MLEDLRARARENDAPVTMIPRRRLQEEIPFIRCRAALHSPTTGIIDTGEYFTALRALLYRYNVEVLYSNTVKSIDEDGLVRSERGDLSADLIINCAGLDSDLFAGQCGLHDYRIRPLKGDYYASSNLPLKIPVYPPPNTQHHTLGLHLTPTFGHEVLIGPSEIQSPAKDDYTILTPRKVFEDALESMLVDEYRGAVRMHEGFSGNRPRAYHRDVRCEDFVIMRRPENVIHLLGIESPGLTAAPALARYVYEMT
jgi:glycerol-3-phosphate dehydrogenase